MEKRNNSKANHSATHLLHHALREVLGTHVEQKGSSVSSVGLRFDFSHFKKIDSNQINEIERFVNSKIDDSLDIDENRNEDYKNALAQGAIGLFGELPTFEQLENPKNNELDS